MCLVDSIHNVLTWRASDDIRQVVFNASKSEKGFLNIINLVSKIFKTGMFFPRVERKVKPLEGIIILI